MDLKVICVLLVFLPCALSNTEDCKNKKTCSSCIQTPNCMWCRKPGNFSYNQSSFIRCRARVGQIDTWREVCGTEYIVEPANYFQVTRDIPLAEAGILAGSLSAAASSSFAGSVHSSQVIQLKPQNVTMRLRIRESESMTVTFRQAEDYPVDLYYLMDLSNSMSDDKESLSALGLQLAEEMQKLTRNFRLGFGSFVDKVVMPYVSTVPEKLEAPCPGCAPPYGFKNAMSLGTDANEFVREVARAPVSGNLDAPEGGFDAIMQAIKCKREIGWRDAARHLLLFSTDAGFHYAGDGKLGGIVKPNDGECHLDTDGFYSHSAILDYPSVSQINQVAKEDNINIIFAVTSQQVHVYKKLSEMIVGSSTGELAANSSNIVNLVKEEYNKITSRVELKDNATFPVTVRYFSRCKDRAGELREVSSCDNLRVGDEVEFKVKITVEECPKEPADWHRVIAISPVALPDTLYINLEMLCDCECERKGYEGNIQNAAECSGQGTYQCGVCSCSDGYRGYRCECDENTPWGSGEIDESTCKETNTSKICSGRGRCVCGVCQCNELDNPSEVIDGSFCQCTNFLCEHHHGKICSGPDHGACLCSQCKCKDGWIGDACQCRNSTENCRNPDTGDICSNRGICECNACKCFETEGGRYSGKWCEDCPLCGADFTCLEFKDCVHCRVFQDGPLMEEPGMCETCTHLYSNYTGRLVANYTIEPVDWAEVEEEGEHICSFYDENDCRFKFVYSYDKNNEPVVRAQRTLECPPKLDILGIVLGVIGAIVAIGLALLIMWKILTTIHDRREYARFEKERMMAKWDTGENPIYQQATTTFKNPIYGGK